jgi:phospholipase/lecithinase/hemolysin
MRATAVFCVALLLGSSTYAAAQPAINSIVVLGDSISDPGNGFVFTKTSATPPDYSVNALLIPSAPYARGGHHLTNGETWIEQLGRSLGLSRSVRPAFQGSNPFAMNFAIGTARARNDGVNPSLSLLVGAFLQKTGGVAPADALYVIQVGGNDVRDALDAFLSQQNPLPILEGAANAIATNIAVLHAAGARQFLVWNVPDLGLTPAADILASQIPIAPLAATIVTQAFNNTLITNLTPVLGLPGIVVVPFDAFGLITSIAATPSQFGLTNVTDACITPDVPPFSCKKPDQYLFWDGIHPTSAAHGIIAQVVAQLLGI